MTAEDTKAACSNWEVLGHPSYVWRAGQERRLALLRRYVPLENRRILDVGCGVGTYVRRFRDLSHFVFGVDVAHDRVCRARAWGAGVSVAPAEALPFADGSFEVVFMHEVVEHVRDDRQAVCEAVRVTAQGGSIAVFAPNRLYPFETHGVYIGKRFVFGLVPFVNYLPDELRDIICPHVRSYSGQALRELFRGLPGAIVAHECVYPGFDNIAYRSPLAARALRSLLYQAEQTPLRHFGLSHFVVFKKGARPTR